MTNKWILLTLLLITAVTGAQDFNPELSDGDKTVLSGAEADQIQDITTQEAEEISDDTEVFNNQISPYVQKVDYTLTVGDKLFASPKAQFEVQGMDNQSGLKQILVSIDGSVFAPYKQPISFSQEGEHTLLYKFIDRVGNESYSQPYSVTVDATPPRVVDILMDPPPYKASGFDYIGPNTQFDFKAYDDLTGIAYIDYSCNGKDTTRFVEKTSVADLGYTDTSAISFSYQATDMVGNISSIKSKTFILDVTPPQVNVFAKAFEKDGVRYISNKDVITVEAYDADTAVSKILYTVEGEEFKEYDAEIGIQITRDGKYTIRVKAIDMVGNVSPEVLYDIVIDSTAPTGNASYVGFDRSKNENAFSKSVIKNDSIQASSISENKMGTSTDVVKTQVLSQSGNIDQNVEKENKASEMSENSKSQSMSEKEMMALSDTTSDSKSKERDTFDEIAPEAEQNINARAKILNSESRAQSPNELHDESKEEVPCAKVLENEV